MELKGIAEVIERVCGRNALAAPPPQGDGLPCLAQSTPRPWLMGPACRRTALAASLPSIATLVQGQRTRYAGGTHSLHLRLREMDFPALHSQHPFHGQWSRYAGGLYSLQFRLREMDVPALHSLGGVGSVGYYLSITCMLPARGAPAFTERMQVTKCASGVSCCSVQVYCITSEN